MARKRLTKGANALRVEERIARVPADLGRPAEAETGIFEALRNLEQKDGAAGGPRRAKSPEPRPLRAARVPGRADPPKPAAPKAAEPTAPAPKAAARAAAPEAAERLGPGSFTRAERQAIVVSCTEYRNRLPTYLLSARREVEIIDSILRKCERAERDAGRGSPEGGGGD